MIRVPLWKTRNNLHPRYIAKLPKNSESWRINPIYQTSEETCAHSPRALNGWRLISKPNADTVRLGIETTSKVGQRIARISPYDAADCRAGNTLFVGHVRQLKAVLGAARRQFSMEEPQENAARPDSEHYREMARKLRELAREFQFPGARQELLDLASRFERRADSLDARAAAGSDQDHR